MRRVKLRSGRQRDGPHLLGSPFYEKDRDRGFLKLSDKIVGGAEGRSSSFDVPSCAGETALIAFRHSGV